MDRASSETTADLLSPIWLLKKKNQNTFSIWSKIGLTGIYQFYDVRQVIDIPAIKLLTEFQVSGNCIHTFREDVGS